MVFKEFVPQGWHLPSDIEWTQLENYLADNGYNYDGTLGGGSDKIAQSLASSSGWASSSNTGAVGNTDYPTYRNKSGFTALPGGLRAASGSFVGVSFYGEWWSATSNYTNTNDAQIRYIRNYGSYLIENFDFKDCGFSVHCLKDSNSTEQVTVIFNVDGGSPVSSLTISKNATITKPIDPTKSGYSFGGWYKDVACTNAWNFASDVVTANITLFAKWTTTTFVENKQDAGFKFYPNPAKDKLYINFNSLNISGAIYDLQGKRVFEIRTGINPVDISTPSKGIYFVKIIISGDIIVDKLIKE